MLKNKDTADVADTTAVDVFVECLVGRKVLRSLLDAAVLSLLNENSLHGYALIQALKDEFHVVVGPSNMYPMLSNLEKAGFAVSNWNLTCKERPQKTYTITNKGRTLLAAYITELEHFSLFLKKPTRVEA
ncbi:MAG: PadR family transcriptional regulator [Nitrososphaerota archaeon]|nr:PadR family transcriptional regulator [Nitrososphaerota archaeon]